MGITDVCSPITRKGSKAAGWGSSLSPGARSAPGRGTADSVPPQPQHRGSTHSEPEGGQIRTSGPED